MNILEYKLVKIQVGADYFKVLQVHFDAGFEIASTAVAPFRDRATQQEYLMMNFFLKREREDPSTGAQGDK